MKFAAYPFCRSFQIIMRAHAAKAGMNDSSQWRVAGAVVMPPLMGGAAGFPSGVSGILLLIHIHPIGSRK
jgi:hypothetical protein